MSYAISLTDDELFLVAAGLGMLRFSPMPAGRREAFDDLSARVSHALLRKAPAAYALLVDHGDIDPLPVRLVPSRLMGVPRPIRRQTHHRQEV